MNTVVPTQQMALPHFIKWADGIDLPIFAVVLRPDDRLEFLQVNSALGRVAKTCVSQFPGRAASELFPARVAARLEQNYRSCLQSDAAVSYDQCILLEGRETWWQTTLSQPAGFDGTVVIGISIPITERKEREFAAADTISEMADRFDDLRLFSTMAAHDARSPLATVFSLVDLVRDDFEDMGDGKLELLELASNTVAEALEQIGATLERARTLRTQTKTARKFDLGRVCADIAAMVDPEMTLEINVPHAFIECDDVIVQMCVRNLMTNAARHCDKRIDVTLAKDATPGMVWLEVADDGPGLPEGETLQSLVALGEAREGTHGFGISAISKLVRSRGGTFELLPHDPLAPLTGARFRIALPGTAILDGAPQPNPEEHASGVILT